MKGKFSIAMSLAMIFAMLLTSFALADIIKNNVDATYGGTIVNYTAGASALEVKYYIDNTNAGGSGFSSCDAADGSSATVTIQVPAGSGITASPSSMVFNTCGTVTSNTQSVFFSTAPNAIPGTYSITVTVADSRGNYNGNSAAFSLKVNAPAPSDTTAPSISIIFPDPVYGLNGWFNAQDTVPVVGTVNATDSSNVTSINCSGASLSDLAGIGTANASGILTVSGEGIHNIICSATDGASPANSGAASGSSNTATIKIDTVVPTADPNVAGTQGDNGWYTSDVTVTWNWSDGAGSVSGLDSATCPASTGTTSEGVLNVAETCEDLAGNTGNGSFDVSVDKTAPVLSLVFTPDVPDGNGGWWKTVGGVPFEWTCSDAASDIDPNYNGGCPSPLSGTETAQGTTNFNHQVKDLAGHLSVEVNRDLMLDNIAPNITASATKLDTTPYVADTWTNQDVTVHFTCKDENGSGVATCPGDVTKNTEGTFTVGGAVTDSAGNSNTTSFGPIKIDKTAPVITFISRTAANNNGWNNGDVTVTWSCTDSGSGVVASAVNTTINTEGKNQSATGSCEDLAGNTASNTQTGINIDKTAPVIAFDSRTAANANGWNKGDVTVTWSCTDSESGTVASTVDKTISTEGENQSAAGTCEDLAGNTASDTQTGINIDKTAPALNITGAASGTTNICSALPSKPTFGPTDGLSGVASSSDSWTSPTTPSGAGAYTYTAIATDKAGNTTTETRTYSVTYGSAFSGYLQPINADGSSRFKLGSTVPVKFQLKCGTTSIANATAWMYVAKGDNVPDPGVDEATSTAASTTGNLFRYDSTAQQYIFNLSTKLGYTNPGSTTPVSFAIGSWTLKIKLDDGNWYSVNVQLPK